MKLFHTRYSGLIRQPSLKWAGLLTLGLVLLLVLSGTSLQARAADTAGFSDSVAKLVTDDFDEKEAVIAELTKTDHPQLLNTFRYLLAGELYYQKSDKHVVYAKATDKGYQTYDVVTGEKLQIVDKFDPAVSFIMKTAITTESIVDSLRINLPLKNIGKL